MQYVDVLCSKLAESAGLTVDTAAAAGYVSSSYGATTENEKGRLHRAVDGYEYFAADDVITIMSLAVLFPFGFEQYQVSTDDNIGLSINLIDSALRTSGFTPYVYVPGVNYELSLGEVILTDIVPDQDYYLRLKHTDAKVSMINVPDFLNTKDIKLQTWMKIKHRKPMIPTP